MTYSFSKLKFFQSGEFLGSLLKVGICLAKNVLAPIGITAAASPVEGGIQKKIHGPGTTTLIISNEEMKDIMKIIQALEVKSVLNHLNYE